MSAANGNNGNNKMEANNSGFQNTTVIESRAVQYLLMKVRDKNLHGKVKEHKRYILTARSNAI